MGKRDHAASAQWEEFILVPVSVAIFRLQRGKVVSKRGTGWRHWQRTRLHWTCRKDPRILKRPQHLQLLNFSFHFQVCRVEGRERPRKLEKDDDRNRRSRCCTVADVESGKRKKKAKYCLNSLSRTNTERQFCTIFLPKKWDPNIWHKKQANSIWNVYNPIHV